MSFLRKVFGSVKEAFGYAYPQSKLWVESLEISLADVMQFYHRDPLAKASVDVIAGCIGVGFYTTANMEYERAEEAKNVVDEFCANVELDTLLVDMAKQLVACGNDFWLKITPKRLEELVRLPVDCIEKAEIDYLSGELKIPYKVAGYKLSSKYGGEELKPESVIHWRINVPSGSAFGVGLLQVLLQRLKLQGETRPSFAEMKATLERLMPKIVQKWSGPDVVAYLDMASNEAIKKFEAVIKQRPEEGAWIFYNKPVDVKPVTLDPRVRFEKFIEHITNNFMVGCESPLGALFSSPGYLTKATAETAKELQDLIVLPIQRYIKRRVEHDIFDVVLSQAGYDPAKAQVRLNWGTPEKPQIVMADMIRAAELGLIRPEEFRKNAVKFGWELWESEQAEQPVLEERRVKSKWLLQKLE